MESKQQRLEKGWSHCNIYDNLIFGVNFFFKSLKLYYLNLYSIFRKQRTPFILIRHGMQRNNEKKCVKNLVATLHNSKDRKCVQVKSVYFAIIIFAKKTRLVK